MSNLRGVRFNLFLTIFCFFKILDWVSQPQWAQIHVHMYYIVLQTRRGKRGNYRIIFHITPSKRLVKMVLMRGHIICFR